MSVVTRVVAGTVTGALCSVLAGGALAAGANATLANLQTVYANGALAKAQCEAFKAKALEEGHKSVAALFKAAAMAESIHLEKYAMAIKELGGEAKTDDMKPEVKSTKENLELLLTITRANAADYAGYVKQAESDKNEKAVLFLKGTLADEASRAKLYKQAEDAPDTWKAADEDVIVCRVGGYTTVDPTLKLCPVCSAPREKFAAFK